jgi:predicted DNA-binding protein with PD1-like motif
MISKEEGDLVFVKLQRDDSVVQSLEKVCELHSIKNGLVVWGIGMFRTADFGYFNGKEYVHKIIQVPGEVVSFHGSIASTDPRFHLHASIALMNHEVVGGHLFNAVVSPLMEIQVSRLRGIQLTRQLNDKSGLKEIEIS